MAHDDQVTPLADGLDNGIGVIGQARGVVVARQVGSDHIEPPRAQFGGHQMPAPAAASAAVYQHKSGQVPNPEHSRPSAKKITANIPSLPTDPAAPRGSARPAIRALRAQQSLSPGALIRVNSCFADGTPQAVPAGGAAGIGWPPRGGPPNADAAARARVTATYPGGHRRDDRAEADPVDEQAGGEPPWARPLSLPRSPRRRPWRAHAGRRAPG